MILCAGFGTRLRPLTCAIPKPLVPVGRQPAFLHIVDALRQAGLEPLVINTHHHAEAFSRVVPPDIRVRYEPRILGTAGGVSNACELLDEGDVLVWNGDVIAEPDLAAFRAEHDRFKGSGAIATLLAVKRPSGQGTIGVDTTGRLVRIRGEHFGDELHGGDFIGIQWITNSLRSRLPSEGCLVGDTYLPALRNGDWIGVCWHGGQWDDIGSPSGLLQANLRWLDRQRMEQWVHPTAQVAPRVQLQRCIISEHAHVQGEGVIESCVVLACAWMRAPERGAIIYGNGERIREQAAPT